MPGDLRDPLTLMDDLSPGGTQYLGGLNELLRHDPTVNEWAVPLRLQDLDRDAPDPLVGDLATTSADAGQAQAADRRQPRRANAGSGRGEATNGNRRPQVADFALQSGTEGLIRDAEELLTFQEESAEGKQRNRWDDTMLSTYRSRQNGVYELGLISPTVPTSGDEGSKGLAMALSAISGTGMRAPGVQVNMSIPNIGGQLFGSSRSLSSGDGGVRYSSGSRDSFQAEGPKSLVAWVKTTVVEAMGQPMLYIAALVLVGILMIVGLRRTA